MGRSVTSPASAAAARPGRRGTRRRVALATAGSLVAAALLVGLAIGFLRFAGGLQAVEAQPPRHADALVVLTGGADRISDATELLASGLADRLLITGVNPTTSPESLARRLPRLRNLVECCVTLGYQAVDTAGNAAETAAWVRANHVRSLIVVTSNYHMPRALAEIGGKLKGVELLAYPVVSEQARGRPWWTSPHRLRLIASEYVKYVVVLARQALTSSTPVADGNVVARADPPPR